MDVARGSTATLRPDQPAGSSAHRGPPKPPKPPDPPQASAPPGADDAQYQISTAHRWAILSMIVLASTAFVATILISTALLPQMQGALSATQDEVAWVMTFNIVATAVATPMTGWLVARFGRRGTMVWCVAAFAVSTLMCGAADSLETLVFWRIVQGAAGAPIIPLGQTLLFDAFPRRQHGLVIAIYGMSNMVGPVLGPTLGGYIAEAFGWRWGFYMVVPVALIAVIGLRAAIPPDTDRERVGLDWIGFIALSVSIAATQLVFSRGQRLDWFQSTEIVIETVLAILAFYIFLAHALTYRAPFLTLSLLRDRNFSLGLVLVSIFGMLNFAPMVLLPPLLQQHVGYPDSLIGEVVGWRGAGAALGFFIAMWVTWIDPRVQMLAGALIQTASGYWMLTLSLDMTPEILIANSLMQGVAVGCMWVPMTVVTFATLAPKFRPEAMATFHLLRNMGSSLFISIAVAEIVRTTSLNYARLSEAVSPFNTVLSMPWAVGAYNFESAAGLASFAREINRQAAMIGYVNAFVLYTVISAASIPLILLMQRPKQ